MRLNNKGWGTLQMLLMTLLLLVLLAIAWFYISTLFNGQLARNAEKYNGDYYSVVKSSLKESAKRYYEDNNLNGQAILSYDILKQEGYITNLQDFLDSSCTGYVTVNNNVFKPYIKCKNYTSDGYVSDFE